MPLELRDLTWLAFDGTSYQVGTLVDGKILTLLATEIGLDTDQRRVLSIDRAMRSTLHVYDITSGATVFDLPTDLVIERGILFGDKIYYSGQTSAGFDGGVWEVNLKGGVAASLIPASTDMPTSQGESSRGPIKISASGETVGSTVCTVGGCRTEVATVDSKALIALDDRFLAWLSDEYAILIEGQEIRAYALHDSVLRWKLSTQRDFYEGFFVDKGTTFIASSTEGEGEIYQYEIARIDAESGARELIVSFSDPILSEWRLIPDLSTDQLGVLLSAYTVEQAVANGGADVRVLDLTTGAFLGLSARLATDLP